MTNEQKDTGVSNLIRHETTKNIVINLLMNAAIAYAMFYNTLELPLWGETGFGKDLLITGFLLSAILGVIFIISTRRKVSRGEVKPAAYNLQQCSWLFPYNPWLAGAVMGVLGCIIAAPLLIVLLSLLSIETLSPLSYAIIKGIWAGLLAGLVVPLAILQGLRQHSS